MGTGKGAREGQGEAGRGRSPRGVGGGTAEGKSRLVAGLGRVDAGVGEAGEAGEAMGGEKRGWGGWGVEERPG